MRCRCDVMVHVSTRTSNAEPTYDVMIPRSTLELAKLSRELVKKAVPYWPKKERVYSSMMIGLLFHLALLLCQTITSAFVAHLPPRPTSLNQRHASDEAGADGTGFGEHTFAGGKMSHLFEMERGWDETNPKRARYFHAFTSDLAQEALKNSDNMYWKVDGSCGIITYDVAADELSIYQRIDTRGKGPTSTLIDLPAGKNPTEYVSNNQPHSYFMEQVKVSENDGKKAKKNKLALLDVLERNKNEIIDLILSNNGEDADSPFLSVELVGTKYNRTPGVDAPVAIAPHCLQKISPEETAYLPNSLPRAFDELKLFLIDSDIIVEGIVVEHKGQYWKVVSKLFDDGCKFAKEKSSANPPIYFE